jgi:MoaA/NifB/PqqE/SkfB family radical SAM enzyme
MPQYQFQVVYFEATRRCNLRCPLCMTGSNEPKRLRQNVRKELSLEQIRDRIMIPARRLGVHTMAWSGGEFLVRKDALDLLRLTVELGYGCSVLSNCKKLTRERLEKIRDVTRGRARIVVGLNAIDGENRQTRDNESDRTLQVLEDCAELTIRGASRRPSHSACSTASPTIARRWFRGGRDRIASVRCHSTGTTWNSAFIRRFAAILTAM